MPLLRRREKPWLVQRLYFLTFFHNLQTFWCEKETNSDMQMFSKYPIQSFEPEFCLENVHVRCKCCTNALYCWNAPGSTVPRALMYHLEWKWASQENSVSLKVSGISTRCFASLPDLAVGAVYKFHLGEINVNIFNNMFPFQPWLFLKVQNSLILVFF